MRRGSMPEIQRRTTPTWGAISSPLADRFSLVEGGPFYRIQSSLGLAMPYWRHVFLRAILLAGFAWLPLVLLSALEGEAAGGTTIPLLHDFAVNVRLLICLPLLVASETIIDPKVREAVRHFPESGLISWDQLPHFETAIAKTLRLRDAVFPAVLLVAAAFFPSLWSREGELIGTDFSTWHVLPDGSTSSAGWWFAFVSLPVYRLWLLRWIWLIFLWTTFLARVSRLRLGCVATHPDRAGGLGFLARTQMFFGTIGLAASAAVASRFANMIAYQGKTVSDLKFLMITSSVLAMIVLEAPLLVFTSKLLKVKERGLFEYGSLGTRYVQQFDAKWNREGPPGDEALLGTADLQSLADLSNSFAVIDGMRTIVLDRETLLWLGVPVLTPMLILVLTATPVDELVRAVLKLMA